MLRDFVTKSGTYSIFIFVQRLTGLILVPVYTRYLTPADYGVMSLIDLTMTMFTLLVSVKLGYSLFYHWTRSNTDEERNAFLGTAFIGACLLGLLGAAIGWIISPFLGPLLIGTPEASYYLKFAFAAFACGFPIDIGFSLMRIRNQATQFTIASLVRLGLGAGFNIVAVVFLGMGLLGILMSVLASSLIMAAYMAFFVLRGVQFRLSLTVGRKLLGYSLPLLFSDLCGFVINSSDRIFLRWYVPLSEVGLYTLAYRLGMLVTMAYSPVELYWGAQMHVILPRPESAKDFPRLLTYVTLYLAIVALALTLFVEPVANLAIGRDFRGALKYVPWIALASLIRQTAIMARSAIFVEGKTNLEVKITAVGALLCIISYAVLIPRYGSWGCVAGTLAGYLALLIVGQWYAQRLRSFRFEYGRLAKIVACMVLVALLCRWISLDAGIWQIAWAVAAMAAFPLLLLLTGFLEPDERESVLSPQLRYFPAAVRAILAIYWILICLYELRILWRQRLLRKSNCYLSGWTYGRRFDGWCLATYMAAFAAGVHKILGILDTGPDGLYLTFRYFHRAEPGGGCGGGIGLRIGAPVFSGRWAYIGFTVFACFVPF